MEYLFSVFIEKSNRVDMYLSALFPLYSRSYIQKMIDRGDVSINGKVINKNVKIKNRDEIRINIVHEDLIGVNGEKQSLDIIYEDDKLLVVNKDAGINVHPVPGDNGNKNTLVNGVLYHCAGRLPCISGVHRPGIVHRLDKDTSGVILVAKDDEMMSYLSNIIKKRNIEKTYIAIVAGKIREKEFRIESYIGRDPNNRQKMTSKNPLNPKLAISQGKVLGYIYDKYSVLEINIETGRTHQIRVHLSSIGYPIIGDKVYGGKKINDEVREKFSLNRQALHAIKIKFELYGKIITFNAKLKDDMKNIIGNLIS